MKCNFILVVILLSSCSKNRISDVGIFPFILEGHSIDLYGIKKESEDGECEYYLNDQILMNGNLRNGQKFGIWNYSFEEVDLSLDWSIYNEKSGRFSFSYPSVWEIEGEIEDIDLKFRTDKDNKNLQLVIYEHELSSVSLKTYFEDYLSVTKKNYGDINIEAFRFYVEEREKYYIKFTVEGGKNNYVFHGFLFKENGNIYDITYVSEQEDEKVWEVVFFDLLYSFQVNGIRVLPPFSEYLVEPIEINELNVS